MKRFLGVAFVLAFILTGCAVVGSRQKGDPNTPENQKHAGGQSELSHSARRTNRVPATNIGVAGSDGGATTFGPGGQGGAAAGSEGAGAGAATAGHGPGFYVYLLFVAAIVISLIWAIWQRYHRKQRPA